MNMSRKEVVVSNVSKEHDNPIAELVQVACRFDSNITLESDNRLSLRAITAGSMQRVSWESWHLILQRV